MFGFAPGEMLDLLSAGNSRRDNVDFGSGCIYSRHQTPVGDLSRQIVVLFLETERAGHAAAARIHFNNLVTGGFEHRCRRRRADERLLMAMSVQQNFLTAAV